MGVFHSAAFLLAHRKNHVMNRSIDQYRDIPISTKQDD